MRRIDIPAGARFGRLTVLSCAETKGEARFHCACDCGAAFLAASSSLRKGATRSCGCLRKDTDQARKAEARATFADRFWARVDKRGEDDCWEWKGSRGANTYGLVRVPGMKRQQLASRVGYELANGVPPGKLFVCHRCDNPPCVNPKHLFLGTANDNTQDMISKGRDRKARGEANGFAKLTDAQASEIRDSREPLRKIAARLGITFGHAGKIRRGELRA